MKLPTTEPIDVIDLFSELHDRLLDLLEGLDDEDWQRPTVCSEWCVQDIVAHLLDGDLRRLSAQRDGYRRRDAPASFESAAQLVGYLHELNATWTRAARRLSPRVIRELLAVTHPKVIELFRSLDPAGKAIYSVAWAGEDESANWFDIAREYTERWHHQVQIRLAVNRMDDLLSARLYRPVLETFVRALPFTFREIRPAEGTVVVVEVQGETSGTWSLVRREGVWTLFDGRQDPASARAIIPASDAWQVFTKRLPAETALARFTDVRLEGDRTLAGRVLEMISIMA